jgi:hypothetical protein
VERHCIGRKRLQPAPPGSSEYVADLGSRAGTVFGWLLEAGGAVDLAKAADAFARGAAIIDRLAMTS